MSETKYSDFTLNFNPDARGNEKAPTAKRQGQSPLKPARPTGSHGEIQS